MDGRGRRNTEGRGRGRGRGRRSENFVEDSVAESNSSNVGSRSRREDETRSTGSSRSRRTRSTSSSRYRRTRSTGGSQSFHIEEREGGPNALTLENLQTMLNIAITAALDQRLGPRGGPENVATPGMNEPAVVERNVKSWVQYYQDFLKMKPPTFTGKGGATEAHQWCTKVDRILDQFDCSGTYKQRMASFLLEGNAATWWESMGRTVDAMEVTWTRFKDLFLEHFFPFA
ncbi:uncharacterized protein LOC113353028 [Papaver somniferum]|uniref:uncharacterized protein LOC113353028 n=1 Tax=Papaver somniferum TaxID=3469 RepID=UPI000E6FDD68|nr:uncharacterized protein LOC113353028 [Papaver somniferum]